MQNTPLRFLYLLNNVKCNVIVAIILIILILMIIRIIMNTKVKSDHRSKFSNLSNNIGRKKPEKYLGFNGIRTRDLCYTGALLDQLSCEATHFYTRRRVIHVDELGKTFIIRLVIRL